MPTTYSRPQRQQKEDPLQTALQLFQMFNQPQEDDSIRLALDLQNKQAEREQQQGQFAQEQALKERQLQSETDYRTGALEVAGQKNALDPSTRQVLHTQYLDPKSTPAQKMSAKLMLPPEDITALDAEIAAQTADLGLGGPMGEGQAQPATGGGGIMENIGYGQPMAGGGPTGMGFDIAEMLKRMFTQPVSGMQPNPDVFSGGRPPNY